MNIDWNEIKLDHGSIDITVEDGYGEIPSSIDFDLSFLWVSREDCRHCFVKHGTYKTLEEAYRVYCELEKEVSLITGKSCP